ncbi:MAG: glycosyltransferase family 2 protein [Acidobacteria bacterium]|nr:glycosyltransferase family 2 protein [Acidobacteriota bacterium]
MPAESNCPDFRYVLITAAFNEEQHLEETICSVVQQMVRPAVWVIVSDGSTDRTDEIAMQYAARHGFIRCVRRQRDGHRGFASKVFALRAGFDALTPPAAPFIGHVDADLVFPPSYFGDLLRKFHANARLGVAGGWYVENIGREYRPACGSSGNSVPGGLQMFRRECFNAIGPLLPIEFGGEDWYAEIRARQCGWQVESFPELRVRHLRARGKKDGRLRYCYREGLAEYAMGSHPLFGLAKVIRRIPSRPYVLCALARLAGFAAAPVLIKRMVPPELVTFLQAEQLARLRSMARGLLRGKVRPEMARQAPSSEAGRAA